MAAGSSGAGRLAIIMPLWCHAAALLEGGVEGVAPTSRVGDRNRDLAIAANGNYGEIFEANIGSSTPIGLARGLNALWTQGGLQYAAPFR